MSIRAILGVLPFLLTVTGCQQITHIGNSCGRDVLASVPNPDNGNGNFSGLQAKVVRVNCGATTDYSTVVELLRSDGKPAGIGDGTVFGYYHGTPHVYLQWLSSDHLEIACPDCGNPENVYLKTSRYNFTNVSYRQ